MEAIPSSIGFLLLFLSAGSYATFANLLYKKKDEQPVKSRSPGLLMLSLLGNSLSVISLCMMVIFASFNWYDETIDFRAVFVGIIVSEVIAVPLMIMPHIFR